MKASSLKPGMRVLLQPSRGYGQPVMGTVVRHVESTSVRPAYTTIRKDGFAKSGLPDDVGCVYLPDADITWRMQLMETAR
ncbi:hypothetical protein [Pectobacterium aroidearum]|uniref:hypothetical protein n=1 Tax=Pectobacterium aroidearum TaxID=1201031 RepID=UPI0030172476